MDHSYGTGPSDPLGEKCNRLCQAIHDSECPASEEDLTTIRRLLESRADPNYSQTHVGHYTSPLHYAIGHGRAVLALLVYHKADVNIRDRSGETALVYALAYGESERRSESADELVRLGVDVNIPNPTSHYTALHHAVQNGDVPLIRLLLQAGARPDALTLDTETPRQLSPSAEVAHAFDTALEEVNCRIALAQGSHPRLGAGSLLHRLDAPLLPIIGRYLTPS